MFCKSFIKIIYSVLTEIKKQIMFCSFFKIEMKSCFLEYWEDFDIDEAYVRNTQEIFP